MQLNKLLREVLIHESMKKLKQRVFFPSEHYNWFKEAETPLPLVLNTNFMETFTKKVLD